MKIVQTTEEELSQLLTTGIKEGVVLALQQMQAFEQDLPADEIRKQLKATGPAKWQKILKETGARCTRTIDRVDMYLPSAFGLPPAFGMARLNNNTGYMPAA